MLTDSNKANSSMIVLLVIICYVGWKPARRVG